MNKLALQVLRGYNKVREKDMTSNNYKLIKTFSAIFFIITLIQLLRLMLIIDFKSYNYEDLILCINMLIIIIILSIIYIKPAWGALLFFLFIFEATPTITSKEPSLGIFLYFSGILIGLFFGIFKQHSKRRFLLSLIPIISAFVYLFIFNSFNDTMRILIITAFEISILVFISLLFKEYVEDLLPVKIKIDLSNAILNGTNREINLSKLGFRPDEITIISEILNGKIYKEIAQKLGCSTESIKKKVSVIFQKFNCSSKGEFLELSKNYIFIFQDQNQ